jgi:hypothetical protein
MSTTMSPNRPQFATIQQLRLRILPDILQPVPPQATLRHWFKHLPKVQNNPQAKRGTVYYSVQAVEDYLRSRIIRTCAQVVQ